MGGDLEPTCPNPFLQAAELVEDLDRIKEPLLIIWTWEQVQGLHQI